MEDPVFAIIGNDSDAPSRYFDTFRRSEHLEPEKVLLLALLEDAIHLFQKYRGARDRVGKEHFREVDDWFMNQGDRWLFSFENVCDLLELDPQYVRRGLLALTAVPVPTQKRGRHGSIHREAA